MKRLNCLSTERFRLWVESSNSTTVVSRVIVFWRTPTRSKSGSACPRQLIMEEPVCWALARASQPHQSRGCAHGYERAAVGGVGGEVPHEPRRRLDALLAVGLQHRAQWSRRGLQDDLRPAVNATQVNTKGLRRRPYGPASTLRISRASSMIGHARTSVA
jgi:hypothetical protein